MKRILLITGWVLSLWLTIIPSLFAQQTLADRLKSHVYTLAADSLQGRSAGSVYAQKAAAYIAAQWKEIGITPWNGVSYYRPFRGEQYSNLVGIIEGNHPVLKNEYIVVGAHYDHLGTKVDKNGEKVMYPGADDNASGTATAIELGRIIKSIQPLLGRSVVLIAFDAEEIGLYGSNDFAHAPPFPIEQVKLMLSIDMVGWYKASGYLKYVGSGTIRKGEQILTDPKLIPEGLHIKTQNFEKSILTATDTQAFAFEGVPTLAVTTGFKSPYHKPGDVAQLIDYDGMALITEHLANVVRAVSTDEGYAASGKLAAKHTPPATFNMGISAQFGSNYHFYTSGAVDGKSAGAHGIGITAAFNMGLLAIRPEAYYNYIQARHPDGKVCSHNLTTPLNVVLQTPLDNPAGLAVFAGPYYSYRFGGRQGKSSLDFNKLFYRNEVGINYGVELRLAMIRVGVTRRQAYTTLTRNRNGDGAFIRNRSVFTTLTYVF
ncbi:MAG: M28 family peptidase [Bacteroidetes bacterium]|nr:M28 family peptidase [Bacteroidota bacterium]